MLASHDENSLEDEKLLTGTGSGGVFTSGYLRDQPLIEYLDSNEQVAYLLSNTKNGLRRESEAGAQAYTPGDNYRAITAITDERVLFVVGDVEGGDGDRVFSVPYSEIEDVKTQSGVLKKRLDVWTTQGIQWSFFVKKSMDVEPAADYADLAAVVWSRVDRKLRELRKQVAALTAHVDADDYDAARVAAEEASDHLLEAREKARELTTDESHAVWERIETAEDRLADAIIEGLIDEATHHAAEAERQWRSELYNQAYDNYERARTTYQRALDVAESRDNDVTTNLLEKIDSVTQHLERLSRSPLQRAAETRDRAVSTEDPAIAADLWEDALEKYQTVLVLDWGNDEQRFAGDSESIRTEIDRIAGEIESCRRTLADRHRTTGDWYADAGQFERATQQYALARDQLQNALAVADEFRPDAATAIREDVAELEQLVERTRDRIDDSGFAFVGDVPDATGPNSVPDSDAVGDHLTPDSNDVADSESVREKLAALDPTSFRRAVARIWSAMDWSTTLATEDATHDVRATDGSRTHLLVTQGSPVDVRFLGETVERSLAADFPDHDTLVFVTTGAFTRDAYETARERGVTLVDGDRLATLLVAAGESVLGGTQARDD